MLPCCRLLEIHDGYDNQEYNGSSTDCDDRNSAKIPLIESSDHVEIRDVIDTANQRKGRIRRRTQLAK